MNLWQHSGLQPRFCSAASWLRRFAAVCQWAVAGDPRGREIFGFSSAPDSAQPAHAGSRAPFANNGVICLSTRLSAYALRPPSAGWPIVPCPCSQEGIFCSAAPPNLGYRRYLNHLTNQRRHFVDEANARGAKTGGIGFTITVVDWRIRIVAEKAFQYC